MDFLQLEMAVLSNVYITVQVLWRHFECKTMYIIFLCSWGLF